MEVLLVHHPGRYLVATVVVHRSVARARLLLLLLLFLLLSGLLGTDGGRDWALLGGVDMGVVINLKLGHCKDRMRHNKHHKLNLQSGYRSGGPVMMKSDRVREGERERGGFR